MWSAVNFISPVFDLIRVRCSYNWWSSPLLVQQSHQIGCCLAMTWVCLRLNDEKEVSCRPILTVHRRLCFLKLCWRSLANSYCFSKDINARFGMLLKSKTVKTPYLSIQSAVIGKDIISELTKTNFSALIISRSRAVRAAPSLLCAVPGCLARQQLPSPAAASPPIPWYLPLSTTKLENLTHLRCWLNSGYVCGAMFQSFKCLMLNFL